MFNNADPYEIVEQQIICEDMPYTSYGICLRDTSGCRTICDITTDRKRISDLVDMLNENDLEACQFCDAVEDFLAAEPET